MLGLVFALITSFAWGSSQVFARLGLRGIPTSLANLITLVAAAAATCITMLLGGPQTLFHLSLPAFAWFAMTGLINFVLGRQFNLLSIERLGAARASLVGSTYPLVAMVIAVLFIGERLTVLIVAGAITIVGGLWVVVSERKAETAVPLAKMHSTQPLRGWRADRNLQGYLLALAAAVAWGVNSVLIRKGVLMYEAPLAGAFIAFTTGMFIMGGLNVARLRTAPYGGRTAVLFLVLSGIGTGVGMSFNFLAMQHAPVVVVQPLAATSPLVTLLLARFILPSERTSWQIVGGGCLVILGAILVGLGRT